jgi:hypothetical protein
MSEVWVAHDGEQYRCYVSANGIVRRYLGCRYKTPREAIRHTAPVYAPARRFDAAVSGPPAPAPLGSVGPLTGSSAAAASQSTAGDLGL